MSSIFRYDSPLMLALDRMAKLMLINILWIIYSLPVISIGASTSAAYTVIMKCCRNEETSVLQVFHSSFISNFKQSTLLWILTIPIWMVVITDVYAACFSVGEVSIAMRILSASPALIWIMVHSYLYPLLATYNNTNLQILKNAWLLAIAYPLRSIFMALLNCLPVILFFLLPNVFLQLSILWIVIGVALVMYFCGKVLTGIFKKLEPNTTDVAVL